jgi:hypothetical protein
MAIAKQISFEAEPAEKDAEIDKLYAKLNATDNLEYAVLLAHVLIQEELVDILGLRLRTDALPERMPGFEALAGLALAGSSFVKERLSLELLNRARNTIAHRTDRKTFEKHLSEFSRREWQVSVHHGKGEFAWPADEQGKVKAFSWGYHHLWLRLVDLKDRMQAWNHQHAVLSPRLTNTIHFTAS